MLFKINDPNFLRFLQTKKFKAALCDENGKKNQKGPFIDSEAEAVLNKTEISIRMPDIYSQIKDITGIEVFKNLTSLQASRIGLEKLANLPEKLEYLNLEINHLKEINNLPETLKTLNLTSNDQIKINFLPENLEELICNSCELEQLPELPKHLKKLHCRDNQLTTLPSLPDSLIDLNCSDNQLTEFPELTNDTAIIDISGNKIKKTKLKANESFFQGGPKDNLFLKLVVLDSLIYLDKNIQKQLLAFINKKATEDEKDYDILEIRLLGKLIALDSWIVHYKISKDQLAKIEEITFSWHNPIYSYVPGFDINHDYYDVNSLDGIEELENLKKIHVYDGFNPELDWTAAKNIEVIFY